MATTQYPYEIGAVLRPTKTLAVNAHFTRAEAAKDDIPLAIYDKSFSRLNFAIIDNSGETRKIANANIPINMLAEMFETTKYAFWKQMDHMYSGTSGESSGASSPAYTQQLRFGPYKGKSPARVLAENPSARDDLLRQRDQLQANLQQYPNNRYLIEAINDGVNLLDAGKLEASAATPVDRPIVLYNAEARSLIRKPREDGMCPVYNIGITWTPGEKSPVNVEIMNCYAPVQKFDGGRISPQLAQADKDTVIRVQMSMSCGEWLDIIRRIKSAMRQFEFLTARRCNEEAFAAWQQSMQSTQP